MMKTISLAAASFLFVMGIAHSSMAGQEKVVGTVLSVDATKGVIVVKTDSGPRELNGRIPEKLKDIKPGERS